DPTNQSLENYRVAQSKILLLPDAEKKETDKLKTLETYNAETRRLEQKLKDRDIKKAYLEGHYRNAYQETARLKKRHDGLAHEFSDIAQEIQFLNQSAAAEEKGRRATAKV